MVSIRLPAPQKGLSPFGWSVIAFTVIALALTIVAIALTRTLGSDAIAHAPISAPAANAPASAPAANSIQIQRLGPAALRNTQEAQLGNKMLGPTAWSLAFTDKTTEAALLACKQSIGRKIGGGESTSTILQGTTVNDVIASITWQYDLQRLFDQKKTATGTITLNFSHPAGEPKISGASC